MTSTEMGSNESRFNVSLIVRENVTRPCPQTTTFEEKGELKRIRTEVPPLTSLRLPPTALPLGQNPNAGSYIPLLFGHTKTPHTLIGMGSAALALPFPR